ETLEDAGEKDGDVSRVVITKLGIFDLVGLRRLCEYHSAMGPPQSQLRLYLVAERLLLHYSGQRYHPAVIAVIADMLSANYNILSKIVLSDRPADARHAEPKEPEEPAEPKEPEEPKEPAEPFDSLPFDPGMPAVASTKPTSMHLAGDYLLLLVKNVGPIRARGSLRFRYVLAACDRRRKVPVCFVTLENATSISNVLCVFEADGSHSNYGAVQDCKA